MAELPAVAIYAAIGVLAALENIFPPVPADTAVALGAFLAAREPTVSVAGVYLVTLVGNLASAVGVFLAARRFGPPFFGTRLGRRLISERAMRRLEAVYARHHSWGIFVSRFLPGYRAVVPPFAGIAGVPPSRALPPVMIASALYYGILTALAYALGDNWERVRRMVAHIGAALGLIALLVTVALLALAVYALRRSRRADTDG